MARQNKIVFVVRYQDETANAYDSTVSLYKISSEKLFDTRQTMALWACVTSSARDLYIF